MSTEVTASKGKFVVQLDRVIKGWGSRGTQVEEDVPKEGQ